jgi:hypothetical protein
MFNVKIYKLFNDDLKNLNHQQLITHWKVIGNKEQRICSLESFFKKYPDFNFDLYKENSFNLSDKDELYVMNHYHINRKASFYEDNIINNEINIIKNEDNIIKNEINTIKNEDNIIKNEINTVKNKINYLEDIYNELFIKKNNTKIYDIFLINKNINISELLNYIQLNNLKIKIKNIYIISSENINIYKKLYTNLIIINVKYINNNIIDYILKKNKKKDLFVFTKFNFHEINIFDNIYKDLLNYNIDYINYTEYGLYYFSNNFNINTYFFDSTINNYIDNIEYIININNNKNNKIYNLIHKKNCKLINKQSLNILINFEINNYEQYLSFFFLLNYCTKNKINLFLNNKNILCKNFNNIDIKNNHKNINTIIEFEDFFKNINVNSNINNLIINEKIYSFSINYDIDNNNYLNFDNIVLYIKKLNFLDIRRKIIGIYIDENNFNENYIINCLSKIDFENSYIIIFCENNDFLKELDLLKEISYLNSNELEENLFNNKENILYFMLICDYLILNHSQLSIILSYLNNNSIIFLPYNIINNTTNNNFYYEKYNYDCIQFISSENNNIIFDNKNIIIHNDNYIIYNNTIIKNDNYQYINDKIYLNFYFINKINSNIKLVSIYNFDIKYEYNYIEKDCCIINNKEKIYIKIFDKIKLIDNYEEKIITFYEKMNTVNNSKINIDNLFLVDNQKLFFKLFIILPIPNIYYLTFIKNKIIEMDKNFKHHYFIIINNNNINNNNINNNNDNNDNNDNINNNFINNNYDNYNIKIHYNTNNNSIESILLDNMNNIDNNGLIIIFKNIFNNLYNLYDLQLLFLIKNKILLENKDYKIILKKNYFNKENINIYNYQYFIKNNYSYPILKNNINSDNIIILKYLIYIYESDKKEEISKIILNYEICEFIFKNNDFNYINNIKDSIEFNKINLEIINYLKLLCDSNRKTFLFYLKNKDFLCFSLIKTLIKEVINIKSRNDKLEYIYNHFYNKNISDYCIFKGIVPLKDDIMRCSYININNFIDKISNKYITGSSGCKMSHINLLHKYNNIKDISNKEYLMIIEDDVFFDINFDVYLELALKSIDDFDILYLSVNLNKKEDAFKISPFLLKVLHGKTTTSYVVKIKNIPKIINTIENSTNELDDAYSNSDLNKYCVYPMIVHQQNFKSDISYVENGYGNYHEKYIY